MYGQGFQQLGKSFDVPPTAVLGGVMSHISYCLSHGVIEVPGTEWVEPSLLWLSICMQTGSGKTPLFSFLTSLLKKVQQKCNDISIQQESIWLLDEASFEKMGAIMSVNQCKVFGLYDELSTFCRKLMCIEAKDCLSHMIWPLFCLYTIVNHGLVQQVLSYMCSLAVGLSGI